MNSSKNKNAIAFAAVGVLIAAIIGVIAFSAFGGSKTVSDSSAAPALTAAAGSAPTEVSTADTPSQQSSVPDTESSRQEVSEQDESSREYTKYSFRSKKLFDQHFQKHGSEFGDITQEEYLRLANDLLNSDSDTVLHKTEKEDGDDVFFDTVTGYFLVLSTDGYIRTFFVPDKGIDYFNRQ